MTAELQLGRCTLAQIPAITADGVAVEIPSYSRQYDKRICHIGVGGFHRAHQAWYLHRLLQDGLADGWGIIGIGIRPQDRVLHEVLQRQDGLYSLWEVDGDSRRACVIGSLFAHVDASADASAAIGQISDPATRIVSLTVTEAGYCLTGTGALDSDHPDIVHDLAHPLQPRSAPGLIVRALDARRRAGVGGLTAMSCDNLLENGHRLRDAVLGFAERIDDTLARWITDEVSFPCSMVDRITPAANSTRQNALCADWGVQDDALVVCEPWRQWVIEDHFVAGRPDFEKAGVVWSEVVPRFEAMKVGLLNGGHSALSHTALLLGHKRVHEAVAAPLIQQWLLAYMQEVAETLDAPPGIDLAHYQRSLVQRFLNPAIDDQLQRLAQDTSEKFRQALLPPLQARIARDAEITALATAVAIWMRYLQHLQADVDARVKYQDRDKDRLIASASASINSGDASPFLAWALPLAAASTVRFADAVNVQLASLQRCGLDEHLSCVAALLR